MYARLWWKDARQFWPIWVFLVLAAAVVQMMAVVVRGSDVNSVTFGALAIWAMCWTCLYALAVGAASFAGERETGTLRLLDTIPISRARVWAGKVSFGLVTTLALAFVLLLVAFLGAVSSPENVLVGIEPSFQLRMQVGTLFIVALQSLGWGFLCSAMLNNAVTAAIAAIFCTALGWSSMMRALDYYFYQNALAPPYLVVLVNIGIFLLTIIISLVVFTRTWKFAGVSIGLRAPFVVRSPIELRMPSGGVGTFSAERVASTGFAAVGSAIRGAGGETVFIPGKRSRLTEARALVWQTRREGRGIWFVLALVSIVLPWMIAGQMDPGWIVITNSAVALTAGISVFGLENRGNTQRFLVHHGARPGLVWAVKLGVWIIGLAVIWATLSITIKAIGVPQLLGPNDAKAVMIALVFGGIFAVAQLCGMAFRRGITAWVLGMVAAFLVLGPAFALVEADILWPWTALLIIPAFLFISWLWSGDWLFDRPAPGRWVRLGLISIAVATVLFGSFVAERGWGVANVPAIAEPQIWAKLADMGTESDRDAAPLYREAAGLLQKTANSMMMGVDASTGQTKRIQVPPTGTDPVDLELVRSQALSVIHEAVKRPECRFFDPAKLSIRAPLDLPLMTELANVVSDEFRRVMVKGDLAGAWKEVLVLFQMARHTSELAILRPSRDAFEIEDIALRLGREWALDERQTPERLHEAIVGYPNWPTRISRDEVVRGEARWVERSLARVDEYDMMQIDRASYRKDQAPSLSSAFLARLITLPWERERAKRIARLVFTELLRISTLEPSRWSADKDIYTQEQSSSPLAGRLFHTWEMLRYLKQDTERLVGRRALVQTMAIREWQLRHDGQFPAELEDLVPGLLAALPVDPYSGKPFRYVEWTPPRPPKRDESGPAGFMAGGFGNGWNWPAGTRLLYSVGPDRNDDRGRQPLHQADTGDIIFDIPPIAPTAKAATVGAQETNKAVVDKPARGQPKP